MRFRFKMLRLPFTAVAVSQSLLTCLLISPQAHGPYLCMCQRAERDREERYGRSCIPSTLPQAPGKLAAQHILPDSCLGELWYTPPGRDVWEITKSRVIFHRHNPRQDLRFGSTNSTATQLQSNMWYSIFNSRPVTQENIKNIILNAVTYLRST